MEGYVSENDNGITVVLDTNLSDELRGGRICPRDHQQDPDNA